MARPERNGGGEARGGAMVMVTPGENRGRGCMQEVEWGRGCGGMRLSSRGAGGVAGWDFGRCCRRQPCRPIFVSNIGPTAGPDFANNRRLWVEHFFVVRRKNGGETCRFINGDGVALERGSAARVCARVCACVAWVRIWTFSSSLFYLTALARPALAWFDERWFVCL